MLNIRGDYKEITRHIDQSQRHIIPLAVSSALNKTGSKLNTAYKRALSAELGLPQKAFNRQIKLFRANKRRLTVKEWHGTRKRIRVTKILHSGELGAYYAKGMIEVEPKKIFTTVMPNGHEGQYYRKKKARQMSGRDKYGNVKRGRLPIGEVTLDITEIAQIVLARVGNRKILSREFRRLLSHELQWRLDSKFYGAR